MKIAISTSGKDLDSSIEPRFGRCPYFLIVETEDMSFQVHENENISLGGGAGIQSAQFVASMGAKVVITGNCGPNAVQTLSAAGIELFTGQSGTIKEAIERYKNGELRPTTESDAGAKASGSGTGVGSGRRGMGIGRGMGGAVPTAYVADIAQKHNYEQTIALYRFISDFGFILGPINSFF